MVTPAELPVPVSDLAASPDDLAAAIDHAAAFEEVQDALKWHLRLPQWEQIEPILAALADALDRGDRKALVEATAELELAGPVRIARIGDNPLLPAPPPVRDRLNHLVHSLGGLSEVEVAEDPAAGGRESADGDTDH